MKPFISILIAARNEVHQILSCLQAISCIDYPEGHWEVLIGDDDSEDHTHAIVQQYIADKPHFYLHHITQQLGKAKGKANVLAQLAQQAKGEVFLCTDADVIVPRSWAQAMVAEWKPSIGILTGFTLVEGKNLFAHLQGIDWTWALTLIKKASDLGIPTTAMGNNMLVSRKAYEAVGGYETLPFSVTEDYALFKAITQAGWEFKQVLNTQVMASTAAIEHLTELLQQRKRWMHGAMQVPWYLKLALWIQILWLPIIIIGFIYLPMVALSLWAIKIAIQTFGIAQQLRYLGKHHLIKYLWAYEPYVLMVYTTMTISYYWPSPVRWKGRTYD